LICCWESLGSPEGRAPPADGQQHEQAAVTLVAGSRTGAFAPVHQQRAVLVVHPPLPTTAALGYSHFHHGGKTPNGLGYFEAEFVSLRPIQKGSLNASPPAASGAFSREHRRGRKIFSDQTPSSAWFPDCREICKFRA
jgi:hypothetical protein